MSWPRWLWMRVQTLFQFDRAYRRLDEEVQFHLDQLMEENIAAGMSREEARYAALRAFGNATHLKEKTRETWGWTWLEQVVADLRYSARTLRRAPGFALAAVLVMALGIGTTTALFTVVRTVLLEPLPFSDPERLVRLYEHSSDDKFPYNDSAGGVFGHWTKESHGFSALAILDPRVGTFLSGSGGELPEKVAAAYCSWNLFPTLGVKAAFGRGFVATDDQPSANATVMLTWGLWKRRFGGDHSILNQTIRLNSKAYTVIGILPSWFTYPDQSIQLWTPIYHEQPVEEMQALDSHDFVSIGRLKPGVSRAQATSELSLIVKRLHDDRADNPFVSKGAESRPLLEDIVGEVKTPLYVLLGATACFLLIGCLNVASLLVARGTARRKEFAIRMALGGGRWRLICEHLTESFLLALAGGATGFLIAYGIIQWFVVNRQDIRRIESIHIDGLVISFGFGLVLLCALCSGFSSLLRIDSGDVLSALQESSRSYSAGGSRVGLRKTLLSLEVGLTVVLLIGAGLLLKSYQRLRAADLGCITANVLTMHINLPELRYGRAADRLNFFEALVDKTRALPGVQAAGLVRGVPGEGYMGDGGFAIVEHPPVPFGQMQYAITRWADPGYFSALGIPILRGQTFDPNQRLDHANEVVISDAFARTYFADEDPIGKHLQRGRERRWKIVGVVGDTRFLISKPPQPTMYFPLYEGADDSATLAVHSASNVTEFALPVQQIVQQLDREIPIYDILTMNQIVGKSTLGASFDASLLLAFAILSLILAAVGLFGVLSYIVAQRTTEIGIRLALGAQRRNVIRLMLLDGLRPAFVGILLGVVMSFAGARLVSSLLYGTSPTDPAVFSFVIATILLIAAVACLVPAYQASRLDPIAALRTE